MSADACVCVCALTCLLCVLGQQRLRVDRRPIARHQRRRPAAAPPPDPLHEGDYETQRLTVVGGRYDDGGAAGVAGVQRW